VIADFGVAGITIAAFMLGMIVGAILGIRVFLWAISEFTTVEK